MYLFRLIFFIFPLVAFAADDGSETTGAPDGQQTTQSSAGEEQAAPPATGAPIKIDADYCRQHTC